MVLGLKKHKTIICHKSFKLTRSHIALFCLLNGIIDLLAFHSRDWFSFLFCLFLPPISRRLKVGGRGGGRVGLFIVIYRRPIPP